MVGDIAMKKTTKIAIIYYLVLLGGFFLFVGLAVVGKVYYSDEVQTIFEGYPHIIFPILILVFIGYLYVIRKVVMTESFQEYERISIEKTQKNKKKNKKKLKIIIFILTIYSILHLFFSIYIIHNVRNGNEINMFLKFGAKMVTMPFIILSVAINCYRKNK